MALQAWSSENMKMMLGFFPVAGRASTQRVAPSRQIRVRFMRATRRAEGDRLDKSGRFPLSEAGQGFDFRRSNVVIEERNGPAFLLRVIWRPGENGNGQDKTVCIEKE